jgi:two-component system, NarL family, response regulator DevR
MASQTTTQPIRVFVFEDEWMCREAIQSVIERAQGIDMVGAASTAAHAVEDATALKPDVILMDIRLQGDINGIKATEVLSRRCPEARVVIFTSFPDSDTLNAAILAGAAGYLLKEETGNPDILIQAIREVYQGNAYMTPRISAEILKVIRKPHDHNPFGLTRREFEILKLIADGLNNRAIARKLSIQERTVANHVSNILFKINAKNRTEAACIARRQGLLH